MKQVKAVSMKDYEYRAERTQEKKNKPAKCVISAKEKLIAG